MSRLDFLYRSELPHRAVAVYIYLADRTNENNECWPAIPTIAADLKYSPSTVRRGIRDLKKAGLLETEQRYRKKGGKSVFSATSSGNAYELFYFVDNKDRKKVKDIVTTYINGYAFTEAVISVPIAKATFKNTYIKIKDDSKTAFYFYVNVFI